MQYDQTATSKPRAFVIGGGVAGISTSYVLAKRGFHVTCFEASPSLANACSNAPAGGMQTSTIATTRKTWLSTLKHLFNPFEASSTPGYFRSVVVRWRSVMFDAHWWRWMLHFSKDSLFSSDVTIQHKSAEMLKFTTSSVEMLSALITEHPELQKASHFSSSGALKLLYDMEEFQKLSKQQQPLYWAGDVRDNEINTLLSKEEMFKIEPVLEKSTMAVCKDVVGAIYQPSSRAGNCGPFSLALANLSRSTLSVDFVCNAQIQDIEQHDGSVVGLTFKQQQLERVTIPPDVPVIVAAGAWTSPLLAKLGLYAPLYPLKGYTLVLDVENEASAAAPTKLIASNNGTVYTTRFGEQLRISSFGEFAGFDDSESAMLHDSLRKEAKLLYPGLANVIDSKEKSHVVHGFRPYMSDGCVLAGKVPMLSNLYVNTGPGSNGWKICIGAASLVADAVQNKKNEFDPDVVSPINRVKPAPLFTRLFSQE